MMYIAWEALLEEQVITFLFTCAFDWIWGQRFRQQKRSEKRTEVPFGLRVSSRLRFLFFFFFFSHEQ